MQNVYRRFSKLQKIYRDLIYAFTMSIALFFLALVISFILSRFLPWEPIISYLPEVPYDLDLYDTLYHQLGLGRPLIEQFFIYLGRMFTGNWGISTYISRGMPVGDLIKIPLTRTLELLILPLIIGIILGILFGKLSMRTKRKWTEKLIQILAFTGIAIPIFSLCMFFQYILGHVFPLFPTTGFKNFSYPDPPFVTGFRTIDSFLSKEIYLLFDYIHHLILPWVILTIGICSLTTLLVRLHLMNKSKSRTIVTNSFIIAISFSIIFTYLIFIETIFRFGGLAQLLNWGIRNVDYCVIDTILFLIPMSSVTLIALGNFLFIGYRAYKSKQITYIPSVNKKVNDVDDNSLKQGNSKHIDIERKQKSGLKSQFKDFRKYFYRKLISPFTIIGSMILLFFILISIFPQMLTPYSIQEANGIFPLGQYAPPSPLHPLGQGKFGRDVLARVVYGTRTSLLFMLVPITVGLIGGLFCGIPMGYLNRRFKISTQISMIIFFICPIALFMMLIYIIEVFHIEVITGSFYHPFMLINYGLLLFPFFTLLIAKTRPNGFEIMKRIIPYIPLLMSFIILLQSGMAFLDFFDLFNLRIFSLGADLGDVSSWLEVAPHALFFPSIFLFMLIMGFFLLYIGLQKTPVL